MPKMKTRRLYTTTITSEMMNVNKGYHYTDTMRFGVRDILLASYLFICEKPIHIQTVYVDTFIVQYGDEHE